MNGYSGFSGEGLMNAPRRAFFALFQEFLDAIGHHLCPRPAALGRQDVQALGHRSRNFSVNGDHVGVARTGSGRLDHAQVLSAEVRRLTSPTLYRADTLPLWEQDFISQTIFATPTGRRLRGAGRTSARPLAQRLEAVHAGLLEERTDAADLLRASLQSECIARESARSIP